MIFTRLQNVIFRKTVITIINCALFATFAVLTAAFIISTLFCRITPSGFEKTSLVMLLSSR
jgi:hypothetical protein